MVFVADDLAAWLIGLLADAGRRKLTTLVLGTDQERALRSAATEAVKLTAQELRPGDEEQAAHVALVISQVFGEPVPAAPLAGHETVLEALQAGIAGQLAVLDDASRTGTGQSSADELGVSGAVLAHKLTGHLLREIIVRGSRGGPLFPLASQLNNDLTHLQGQQVQGMLRRLGSEIREALARLDGAHPAVAAPTALAQLPPPVTGFTGRDDELAVLAGLLGPSGAGAEGSVVVSAVAGLAGVGKTTLAVQAAHVATQRGWFTGGVLFIDLHGYDRAPVEPGQALDALLRALAVPAERIPPTVDERAGMYRSELAQIGDPVLVIADNTSSEAQVKPLLPGTGPHKVLVTSRHTLAGLSARLVDVTALDEEAAVGLLDEALRIARPDDHRISVDHEAARRLAGACGGLPLALQIVGALLKADPALSTSDLAGQLADTKDRLALLRYDDGSGAAGSSVAAAFELSYRRLDEVSARVFRLLPINPGPDLSTAAAAVLADVPASDVRKVSGQLARAHLIEAAAGAAGRWRMHDLLRLYAQQLSDAHAEADGREQARDRLFGHYLDLTKAADAHLRALPGMDVPGAFTSRDAALAWLDTERASLVAAVSTAAEVGRDEIALNLPLALAMYLAWRRRFDDWLTITTASVAAARRLGNRSREADALDNLGIILQELKRFNEAITPHQDAIAIYRETGNRHGEGMALNNLGNALRRTDQFEEAITAHQADLAICRETGDRHGEGNALNNLGLALQRMQRFEEAIIAYQGDLAICREIGDRHGEGGSLANLGSALREARRFEEAILACQDAVGIFRETGDRHGEGVALANLGSALREVGRFEEAILAFRGAAANFRESGDERAEGMALTDLAAIEAGHIA